MNRFIFRANNKKNIVYQSNNYQTKVPKKIKNKKNKKVCKKFQ